LFSNLEALMIVTWSFYPFAVGLGRRAHAGLISTHAEGVLAASGTAEIKFITAQIEVPSPRCLTAPHHCPSTRR
jgi:hypothetical protein